MVSYEEQAILYIAQAELESWEGGEMVYVLATDLTLRSAASGIWATP